MADRYWLGTTSTSFNNTANWSTSSGGSGGASIPTDSDTAIYDANSSANCDLDVNRTLNILKVESGFTRQLVSSASRTITIQQHMEINRASCFAFTSGNIITFDFDKSESAVSAFDGAGSSFSSGDIFVKYGANASVFADSTARSNCIYHFSANQDVVLVDGVYPNTIIGGILFAKYITADSSATDFNTYGSVDILQYRTNGTGTVRSTSHDIHDYDKEFFFESIHSSGIGEYFQFGHTTARFKSGSANFRLPVLGDVYTNFGNNTTNTFNVQYHKIVIEAGDDSTYYCYIQPGKTLDCNELVIRDGGRLYGPEEGRQVASAKIKSVKRPTVQGDWNFKQIADGIYESIDNIPTLPVTEGGTGLNTVDVGRIPFGNGQLPLQTISTLNYNTSTNTLNSPNAHFTGKLTVDGLIDPTGVVFTPQATNPESTNPQDTIWIDSETNHLFRGDRDTESTVHFNVRNDEGATIPVGAPLYSKGEIGGSNRIKVGIADASDPNKMPAIGLAMDEMNTTSTKDGNMILTGILNKNITITGVAEQDIIYVAPHGGSAPYLTITRPTSASHLVQNLGVCVRQASTNVSQGMKVAAIGRTNDSPNCSFLMVNTESTHPQSRRLVAGTNITLTDGGAGGDLTIAASGGGISLNGSTANGILTFGNSTTADVEANITASGATLSINNPSGNGSIELGGSTGGFIDLKGPFSNDYDLRIRTTGSGGTISTASNQNIVLDPGSGNVLMNNGRLNLNNTTIEYGLGKQQTVDLATGWYTFAYVEGRDSSGTSGQRAFGEFLINDVDSGRHGSCRLNATHFFGSGNSIQVFAYNFYSTIVFNELRIKEHSTYSGAALQVYVSNANNNLETYMTMSEQNASWILLDTWLADSDTSGHDAILGYAAGSSSWTDFAAAETIDLSVFAATTQGGIYTSGGLKAETLFLGKTGTAGDYRLHPDSAGSGIVVNADGSDVTLRADDDLILHADDDMLFQAGGATKMTLLNTGNFGIGTTNPQATLEVVDALAPTDPDQFTYAETLMLDVENGGSATGPAIRFRHAATNDHNGGDFVFQVNGDGGNFSAHEYSTNYGFNKWFHAANADGFKALGRITRGGSTAAGGTIYGEIELVSTSTAWDVYDGTHTGLHPTGYDLNLKLTAGGDSYFKGGDVGIGTSNPQGNLHVVGATGDAGRIYLSDADNGTGTGDSLLITKSGDHAYIYNRDSGGDLSLGAGNNSGWVTIADDGKVGIGDTNPIGAKLHVEQANDTTVYANTNETYRYTMLLRNNTVATNAFSGIAFDVSTESDFDSLSASIAAIRDTSAGSTAGNHDANLAFATNDAGDDGLTERMRITHDGNVGIGTTDPNQKLTVEGTMSLKEQASANADTAAYGQLWVKSDSPNNLYFTNDAGNDVQITDGSSLAGGGGSGSPAGSDGQIQYNNGGSFGGDADFVWDDSNNRLVIGSITSQHGGLGKLTVKGTDASFLLEKHDDSASGGPTMTLYRYSASEADGDLIGQISFRGEGDTGNPSTYMLLRAEIEDTTEGTKDGALIIRGLVNNNQTDFAEINSVGLTLNQGTFNGNMGTSSYKPAVFMDTGTQNVNQTEATIGFNSEVLDPAGNATLATGLGEDGHIRLVAGGYYRISYSIPINDDGSSLADRTRVFCFMQTSSSSTFSSSTTVAQSRCQVYTRESSGGSGLSTSFIYQHTANNYIRLRIDAQNNTDISTESNQAQISIEYLGPA